MKGSGRPTQRGSRRPALRSGTRSSGASRSDRRPSPAAHHQQCGPLPKSSTNANGQKGCNKIPHTNCRLIKTTKLQKTASSFANSQNQKSKNDRVGRQDSNMQFPFRNPCLYHFRHRDLRVLNHLWIDVSIKKQKEVEQPRGGFEPAFKSLQGCSTFVSCFPDLTSTG